MADTKNTPGSPDGEPVYLVVGFLRRAHGVHGELIMDLHTDFPERLRSGRKLFIGEEHKPMALVSTRPMQKGCWSSSKASRRRGGGQVPQPMGIMPGRRMCQVYRGKIYQHELLASPW